MSDEIIDLGSFILENEPPLSPHIEERSVSFKGRDGQTITGIVNTPLKKPVTQKALFLHEIEGEADGGTMRVLARRYAAMGIATLRIDFAGHGNRKDEWESYSPQTMMRDGLDSIDWLDQQWPDLKKTMLCGFSTGGAISLMIRSSEPRVSKACLLYPVLSFKYNFLAAADPDHEFLDMWDRLTPWRAEFFTKEKIGASLNDGKPFSLTLHTYGAGFLKGCQALIDKQKDIQSLLYNSNVPLTIIQGTDDMCVPGMFADTLGKQMYQDGGNIRLVRMNGMNHWVPVEWKDSVIKQFKKAALTESADFKPGIVTVSIRSSKDFSSLDR